MSVLSIVAALALSGAPGEEWPVAPAAPADGLVTEGDLRAPAADEPPPQDGAGSRFGLKVGELYPLGRAGSRGEATVPGAGVFWLWDGRHVLAEVTVDLHSGDAVHALAAGVGAYYPFLRGGLTPYLGGNLRYATATYGGQGASGAQVGATAGLLYGRLAALQLRAEVGWFVNLFRERLGDLAPLAAAPAPAGGVRDPGSVTHGPSFALGVGF